MTHRVLPGNLLVMLPMILCLSVVGGMADEIAPVAEAAADVIDIQTTTQPHPPAVPPIESELSPTKPESQEPTPTTTNIVIPVESLNLWLYSIIGVLILLGFVQLIVRWIRTSPSIPVNAGDIVPSQVSQVAAIKTKNALERCLPFGIFPGEFMENVKPDRLDTLVKRTKETAVNAFFKALGDSSAPPSSLQFQAAQDALANELSAVITRTDTFELLNGDEPLSDKEVKYLQQSESLLPAIKVPEPLIIPSDVNSLVLCGLVFAGTILGFIIGGAIGRWGIGLSPDAGLLFGGALGAPLTLAGCLWLANNPEMKKWVLGVVGGVALVDFSMQYFKGMIPLPIWIKGNRTAFYKRLVLYVAIVVIVLIVKRDNTFDREQYRETLETFVEQWIRSALPIFAVLLRRCLPDETVIADQTDLTEKLFHITCKLNVKAGEDCKTGIRMLVQEFQSAGYEFPSLPTESGQTSTAENTLVWDDSLKEEYNTFGLIEPGTVVTVEKFPVKRNGVVIEKGLVAD